MIVTFMLTASLLFLHTSTGNKPDNTSTDTFLVVLLEMWREALLVTLNAVPRIRK